jgi:imidazoleglycerol-phosphate dehydratase
MPKQIRQSKISRQTKETKIDLIFNLDGSGIYKIKTGIDFLNHMLELFTKHGLFNLEMKAKGDLAVDYHHTVEDIGICLGKAIKDAIGDKKRISRFGSCIVPMDEALTIAAIDLSGRSFFGYEGKLPRKKIGDFDPILIKEFFEALTRSAEMNLHFNIISGSNPHHIIEAIFKSFAVALAQASRIDSRKRGVPSTKGVL